MNGDEKKKEKNNHSYDSSFHISLKSVLILNSVWTKYPYNFLRNQEELERWAVAAKQKEEDSLALQKYTRADDAKIKEVNLLFELLTRQQLKTKVRVRITKLYED